GKKVLVVGYSGIGDVDIAPHLRDSDAQLFWCDYDKNKIPDFRPDQRNVLSDLSLRAGETKNGMSNVLAALAKRYGWSDAHAGEEHHWQDGMKQWVDETDSAHLEQFVISRLSWVTSWPHVHIAAFKKMDADNTVNQCELAIA